MFSEYMRLSTWALAKVAEYPTLQHSESTFDPLRLTLCLGPHAPKRDLHSEHHCQLKMIYTT